MFFLQTGSGQELCANEPQDCQITELLICKICVNKFTILYTLRIHWREVKFVENVIFVRPVETVQTHLQFYTQ